MYNKDNFFTNTKADFKEVEQAPDRPADFEKIYYPKKRCYKDDFSDDNFDYISRDESGNIVGFGVFDETPWGEDVCYHYSVIEDCGAYVLGQADDGEVSAEYWYTDEGVYRKGNYWGKMGSCYWSLDGQEGTYISATEIGFCRWSDFDDIDHDDEIDDDEVPEEIDDDELDELLNEKGV